MARIRKLVARFRANPTEVDFDEVRLLLELFDFKEVRSKGSHHSFRHADGRNITVPKKGGRKVKGNYVRQIVELLNLEEWQGE